MYRSGIEIPKVSFSSLQYDRIPINSYFLGFNLDNFGKLSKIERNGTITPIEFNGNFIEIQKDAVQLTPAASVINFTGSGVTATAIGSEITINIPTPPSGISLTDLSVTQPLLYNNLTGAFSIQLATTSQLGVVKIGSGISVSPDGTISALAGGSVTSVGIQIGTTGNDVHILNSPVTSSGSINLNIPTAAPGIRGALSGTDWVTFNNKISPARLISTTAPLSGGGDLSTDRTLSISQANTTSSGYLSSGDWNTFNDKIGGSGTLNYAARFTGTNTIGIGIIQDNNHQAAVNDTPSFDTMLKVNADGFEQYAIKAINTSGGGFAYPAVGLWSQSENRAGDAYGADIRAESTVGQTSIGARVIALDGSYNYSLELLDGTETPTGGKFLRDMGAGKANWAEINLDHMETLTRPQIAALITSNSLVPGKWYRHQYSILRHSQGGIDSHYDIILLATSTNTLSTRGHRIMRVPNYSEYVGGMFDDRTDYYVGMEAIFGNLVYICIQDCPPGTIPARTNIDPLYFDVIDPLTNNQYYTTQVYDIIFNWDYENNGPNDDWEGSNDRIMVQSDNKGNVVHRTAEIDTFDSYYIQQSSIDLHEWNNSFIRDNEFYGAWNNARRTTLRVPSSIYQNRMMENTVSDYYGQEAGIGLIWKNKCTSIFDNKGGSIYNNPKAHEISRNDCTLISNNTIEYGKISDNLISEISNNIIGGSIIANLGKYYDNSDNTKIKGNEGGFELGIVDNELFAGGEISFNNISVTVRHNRIYKIINNGQLGGLEGALEINSNFGMFIISENQLVSTSKINGNTIAQSLNSDNPYSENGIFGIVYNTCDSIMYNNLLEGGGGIYNNSNEGEIRANRVVVGIWNNYSPVQEISYNDAYSIQNNS